MPFCPALISFFSIQHINGLFSAAWRLRARRGSGCCVHGGSWVFGGCLWGFSKAVEVGIVVGIIVVMLVIKMGRAKSRYR